MKIILILWINILSIAIITAQDLCSLKAIGNGVSEYNANNFIGALEFFNIAKKCKDKDEKVLQYWIEECRKEISKSTTLPKPTDLVGLGDDFYGKGIYTKAFECYIKAANNGNAAGQYKVANMYKNGEGISGSDLVESNKWLLKSSNQGFAKAQFVLGYDAFWGEEDFYITQEEAWELMKKSANQGYGLAQMWVGLLYCGNVLSFSEGMKWLLKAAKQGYKNVEVCDFLAISFEEGCPECDSDGNIIQQCEKDYVEAIKWYKEKIVLMNQEWESRGKIENYKYNQLGYTYFKIGDIYRMHSDYKNAIIWYSKSVEFENDEAQYELGKIFLKKDSDKNCEEGMNLLLKAAKQNNVNALYELGEMFMHSSIGGCTKTDYSEALKWYLIAIENDNRNEKPIKDLYNIGLLYLSENGGIKPDYQKAKYYLSKISENRDTSDGDLHYVRKANELLEIINKKGSN